MVEELVAYAQAAFGWRTDVTVTAGPSGALGQMWRLDVGPARYALKEILAEPPTEAVIKAELEFARRATEAGVSLPSSHPDLEGRHLLVTPGGKWLRLYDWIDLRPVDLSEQSTPAAIGTLLARLHRCAPATTVEPGGGPPDPWYATVPAAEEWTGTAEATRLAEVSQLYATVAPADPGVLIMCHRDLHPENVLADPDGTLVVVDWDNLGPAEPGRELARALFDWFCDGPGADLGAMRAMYDAYVRAGGPGRITQPADFSMLIASRLNFLRRQMRIAVDPHAEPRQREWAEHEIDEGLRILPTPRQLADVLTVLADLH